MSSVDKHFLDHKFSYNIAWIHFWALESASCVFLLYYKRLQKVFLRSLIRPFATIPKKGHSGFFPIQYLCIFFALEAANEPNRLATYCMTNLQWRHRHTGKPELSTLLLLPHWRPWPSVTVPVGPSSVLAVSLLLHYHVAAATSCCPFCTWLCGQLTVDTAAFFILAISRYSKPSISIAMAQIHIPIISLDLWSSLL